MKIKLLPSLFALLFSFSAFSAVITVNNSGFTFSPANITINFGDTVVFTLGSNHNAVEVSQATYNANGSTALSGGFSTNFGGGTVLPTLLSVGTHYYVCTPHATVGMKGTINVVQNTTGVSDLLTSAPRLQIYPNPAKNQLSIRYSAISSTKIEVRLYSLSGVLSADLFSGIINTGNFEKSFDLNSFNLSSGVYALEILAGDRKEFQMIFIE
jgi:plastocyanin